ncbi:MAG: ArsR family transcriptional regulator [Candidatus Thermoplasmatota archaeon]|jgi:predicted transcriptional regulator
MPQRPDHLLDLEVRRRLFQLIQDYPGLHEREAARQLRTSQALVNFHRVILDQNGLLRLERGDGTVRMYARAMPAGPTTEERRILGVLRNRLNLHLTLILLRFGRPTKHGELAEASALSKSKVSFYLRKLEAADIVRKTAEGTFVVTDQRLIHRTLARFQPTPDLLQAFSDLWSALYDM